MSVSFSKIKLIGFCTLSLVLFFNVASRAEDIETVKTKAVEDLFVRVFSSHGTTNNTCVDDKLEFCVWRMTGNDKVTLYMPTALEYVYQLELLDTNGIAMPKKKLAEQIGAKFLNLKPSFANDTGFKLKIERTTPNLGGEHLFFPYMSHDYHGQSPYSPDDLFAIKQPGNYTLRIQFQFLVATNSNVYKTVHVVRFPPLDYPLVKFASPTNSLPKQVSIRPPRTGFGCQVRRSLFGLCGSVKGSVLEK